MKVGFLLSLSVMCLGCLDSCFANPNSMLAKRGGLVLLLVTSMLGQCFATCLYNYGQAFGDSRLVFSDDASVKINLNPPFRFYGVDETAMWMSSNGVITFDGAYTTYTPKHAINDYRRKIIAVMHDDLFNNGHDAFYRQSNNSRDLELSTAFVRKLFPSQGSFTATRAIVLTWDRFKLYRVPAGVSPVLTLQTALISSNTISVVINLYIEVNYNQYSAIIGVHAGDGHNYKELCFSGTSNTVLIDDQAQQADSTNGLYGFIVEKGQSTACVPSVPGLDVTPVALGHGTCVFDCDCIDSFAVCNGTGKCVCPADRVDNNTDSVLGGSCQCKSGFSGYLCDIELCRPLPADVVFVLDSSVSITESQFNKQLEFVSNFTDEIRLGPRDFQIAVITYSFEAHIEFYLNTYRDNVTMKEAIANITYKPGITNTHLALEKVQELFIPGHGGDVPRYNNTMADRFVYLLTDGLSNDPQRTVQAATTLKHNYNITIVTIGVGVDMSHAELYKVASPSVKAGRTVRQVYSVQNLNPLYTVLKDLVHFDCAECNRSKKSDVAVVMDTSYTITDVQLYLLTNAITYVIEHIHLGQNETNISFTTFGSSIQLEFGFNDYNQLADILAHLHTVSLSTGKPKVDIVRVLSYVMDNVLTTGRPDARPVIIIAGNGNYSVSDLIKFNEQKRILKKNGVDIIAIGSGSDVIMTNLEILTSDPFNVYVVTDDERSFGRLTAIQSSFVYSECDLQ